MELENSGGYHLRWFLPFFGLDFCFHATPLLFENVFVDHILWGECYVASAAEGIEPGLVCLCRAGYCCSLYCCQHVTLHLKITSQTALLQLVICIFLYSAFFACFLPTFLNLYSFFFELWSCILLASELLFNWNNFLNFWDFLATGWIIIWKLLPTPRSPPLAH